VPSGVSADWFGIGQGGTRHAFGASANTGARSTDQVVDRKWAGVKRPRPGRSWLCQWFQSCWGQRWIRSRFSCPTTPWPLAVLAQPAGGFKQVGAAGWRRAQASSSTAVIEALAPPRLTRLTPAGQHAGEAALDRAGRGPFPWLISAPAARPNLAVSAAEQARSARVSKEGATAQVHGGMGRP